MENEETKEVVEETTTTEAPVEENKVDVTAVPTTTAASAPAPKNNSKMIIIILVGLLIVAGVVIGVLLFNKDKKDDKNTTTVATVEMVKITFDTQDGNEIDPLEVKKNEQVTLPTATKEGYTFVHWKDDKDVIMDTVVTFDEDTKLTAEWKEITPETKTIKVTFDSKGGSKVATTTYECKDDSVTIKSFPKAPTKDGYTFRAWEDKNGKAILEGAKLTCEDLKLYAGWDKKEEPAPTPTPTVEYTCPDGYTLDGTKCNISKTATKYCPEGTREDGDNCVKLTDYNQGDRTCPKVYIEGHDYQGTKVQAGTTFCLYGVYESITSQSTCESTPNGLSRTSEKERYYGWYGGKCYKAVLQNYETTCGSGYAYYTSAQLLDKFNAHNNGGCYKSTAKSSKCEDGFTLSGDKCVKTIDATKK